MAQLIFKEGKWGFTSPPPRPKGSPRVPGSGRRAGGGAHLKSHVLTEEESLEGYARAQRWVDEHIYPNVAKRFRELHDEGGYSINQARKIIEDETGWKMWDGKDQTDFMTRTGTALKDGQIDDDTAILLAGKNLGPKGSEVKVNIKDRWWREDAQRGLKARIKGDPKWQRFYENYEDGDERDKLISYIDKQYEHTNPAKFNKAARLLFEANALKPDAKLRREGYTPRQLKELLEGYQTYTVEGDKVRLREKTIKKNDEKLVSATIIELSKRPVYEGRSILSLDEAVLSRGVDEKTLDDIGLPHSTRERLMEELPGGRWRLMGYNQEVRERIGFEVLNEERRGEGKPEIKLSDLKAGNVERQLKLDRYDNQIGWREILQKRYERVGENSELINPKLLEVAGAKDNREFLRKYNRNGIEIYERTRLDERRDRELKRHKGPIYRISPRKVKYQDIKVTVLDEEGEEHQVTLKSKRTPLERFKALQDATETLERQLTTGLKIFAELKEEQRKQSVELAEEHKREVEARANDILHANPHLTDEGVIMRLQKLGGLLTKSSRRQPMPKDLETLYNREYEESRGRVYNQYEGFENQLQFFNERKEEYDKIEAKRQAREKQGELRSAFRVIDKALKFERENKRPFFDRYSPKVLTIHDRKGGIHLTPNTEAEEILNEYIRYKKGVTEEKFKSFAKTAEYKSMRERYELAAYGFHFQEALRDGRVQGPIKTVIPPSITPETIKAVISAGAEQDNRAGIDMLNKDIMSNVVVGLKGSYVPGVAMRTPRRAILKFGPRNKFKTAEEARDFLRSERGGLYKKTRLLSKEDLANEELIKRSEQLAEANRVKYFSKENKDTRWIMSLMREPERERKKQVREEREDAKELGIESGPKTKIKPLIDLDVITWPVEEAAADKARLKRLMGGGV